MPKYSPTNLDTVGLRKSPRIANIRRKQLDASLNHVGFIHVNKAPEEDMIDPMKETFTFKEAMISPYKKNFVEVMEKEMDNHIKRKHWTYCKRDNVLFSSILRSTWTFKIKRNRSTGDIIKFKARFCADGRTQQQGINFYETYAPVVKWLSVCTMLTISILHNLKSNIEYNSKKETIS